MNIQNLWIFSLLFVTHVYSNDIFMNYAFPLQLICSASGDLSDKTEEELLNGIVEFNEKSRNFKKENITPSKNALNDCLEKNQLRQKLWQQECEFEINDLIQKYKIYHSLKSSKVLMEKEREDRKSGKKNGPFQETFIRNKVIKGSFPIKS